MDLSTLTHGFISLLTLSILEIVLGVDNLVFISMVSRRVVAHRQKAARRIGLLLALGTRLILLASVVWVMGLQKPLFALLEYTFSGRDLLCLFGGIFLLYKGTLEIHAEFEVQEHSTQIRKPAKFYNVVLQIAIFDLIFSLDSVLTAIGLTQNYPIMATAITIAMVVMMIGSEPTSRFVHKYPSIRMLAWSFLLLVGVALIADGLHFHIPRGYIYFAVCFSIFVEVLNSTRKNKKKKKQRDKQSPL